MVVVVMMVLGIVIKVLVWRDSPIINMAVVVEVSVIDVLADVETVVVGVIVFVLKLAWPASYSAGVPSDVTVDLFMDALADTMLGFLPGIDIEVLANVDVNAFAVVVTDLEFSVSTPLKELSR